MKFRLSATVAWLAAGVLTLAAQQADIPVFRSTVDAIEIDAFVVDASGNPVTDLTVDDFELFEDGRPQEITSFTLVNIPIERAVEAAHGIAPDVHTNERPEGRIYLIAVDEIPGVLTPRLRLYLRRFIEQHFGDNDTAAIVYAGRGSSKDTQDFTSDRQMLLKSVDKLSGGFGGSDLETNQLLSGERDFLLRQRMRNLRSLTEFMARMHGRRKSILYVSTGLGMSVFEALDYEGGVRSITLEDLHATITAATRGDVSIYPLDPSGITPGGDITDQAVADPENTVPEPSLTTIGNQQDLRVLAETTGGFAITNSNSFDQAFTQIVKENSTYYVLGFTTTTPRTDGRFHKVQIRLKRPGLQVRSREGYLAPLYQKTPNITRASTLAPGISDALQSPIAVAGVPIRVFAAPYKRDERQAKVAIAMEFGVDALALTEKNGRFIGDLAVALRPVNSQGKLLTGQRHEVELNLKPETYSVTKPRGIRMVTEMALEPGRYQLRIAGGRQVGRAGSVTYDLDIPDYTKDAFIMSGVSLTSSTASDTFTIAPAAKPLSGVFSTPLTAAREFWPDETVTVYAELYENGKRAAHTIDFKVDLRDDSGRVVGTFSSQKASAAGPSTYAFLAPIPLNDVAPGAYVLHVAATADIGSKATVTKDIRIRVRE
jgi:VWFA-related protein